MGEYFVYANLDRREYFDIGGLGGSIKASGLGLNPASRGLGLLLLTGDPSWAKVPGVGRWAGESIAAVGDYAPIGTEFRSGREPFVRAQFPTEMTPYEYIEKHYANVISSVAAMILRVDGPEWLVEVSAGEGGLFVLLSELHLIHHVPGIGAAMDAHLGPEWMKRYKEQRHHWYGPTPAPSW
jgi:hypothetical protein